MTNEMKSFDRPTLRTLRTEIEAALETIAAEYGLTFTLGSMRYSDTEFSTKLTGTAEVKNEAGETLSPEQTMFNQNCAMFGLTPEDYRRTFTLPDGRSFKLVGIKPRATKYPFIGEGPKGGRYKFHSSVIRNGETI